jgi:phospho-N-acetylmuramoyl-pentapeptide-transferase
MNNFKQYLYILLIAFSISFTLILILLPLLKKIKAGQYILGYVEEHKYKSGTPTMGGFAFIIAVIISCIIFIGINDREVNVCLAVGFSYMIVGFLDDFIKIKFKQNLGLKSYQKILFQFAIGIIASIFAYKNGFTEILIPFFDMVIDLKIFYIPIATLVFVFITNSVNLTDGLDGLAGGVTFIYFLFIAIIILIQNSLFYSNDNYSMLSFAICGSLLAFLAFNTNKAKIFMGDTGSLALGGLVASISILSGNMLFIPILGIMYVLSSISVILQVLYYKKTKKRIFLMAPLHHHFQHKGWTEAKISYVYSLITALCGIICLLSVI